MTEQTHEPAPAPWDWQASGQAGSNGLFNLYIVDANGRKIAAVWGKPGEKEATCRMIVAAPELFVVATHPVLEQIIAESNHPSVKAIFEPMRRAAIAMALGTDDGAADMAAPLAPGADSDATAMARG